MTEPRTRTAVEVADHASLLLDEVQDVMASTALNSESYFITSLLERLVAQVEDLAAEVARHDGMSPALAHAFKRRPFVEDIIR